MMSFHKEYINFASKEVLLVFVEETNMPDLDKLGSVNFVHHVMQKWADSVFFYSNNYAIKYFFLFNDKLCKKKDILN